MALKTLIGLMVLLLFHMENESSPSSPLLGTPEDKKRHERRGKGKEREGGVKKNKITTVPLVFMMSVRLKL